MLITSHSKAHAYPTATILPACLRTCSMLILPAHLSFCDSGIEHNLEDILVRSILSFCQFIPSCWSALRFERFSLYLVTGRKSSTNYRFFFSPQDRAELKDSRGTGRKGQDGVGRAGHRSSEQSRAKRRKPLITLP